MTAGRINQILSLTRACAFSAGMAPCSPPVTGPPTKRPGGSPPEPMGSPAGCCWFLPLCNCSLCLSRRASLWLGPPAVGPYPILSSLSLCCCSEIPNDGGLPCARGPLSLSLLLPHTDSFQLALGKPQLSLSSGASLCSRRCPNQSQATPQVLAPCEPRSNTNMDCSLCCWSLPLSVPCPHTVLLLFLTLRKPGGLLGQARLCKIPSHGLSLCCSGVAVWCLLLHTCFRTLCSGCACRRLCHVIRELSLVVGIHRLPWAPHPRRWEKAAVCWGPFGERFGGFTFPFGPPLGQRGGLLPPRFTVGKPRAALRAGSLSAALCGVDGTHR